MSWESDWKSVCEDIMRYGIPETINSFTSEEDVMKALKKIPYCPRFSNKNWNDWGNESSHKENWKQA